MSNSGDNNAAQNAENTPNGENANLPQTTGPPVAQQPVGGGNAAQPTQGGPSGSGDFPSKAPMPGKGSWPPRLPKAPADQDQQKETLLPPYEAPKIEEGQTSTADYAALGPTGSIAHMAAIAAKDAAVAGALACYPTDPTAAAIATTEALTGVLKNVYSGPAPGGPNTQA